MGIRKVAATMASDAATWGLRKLARSAGANMPGKIALKIDPAIIRDSMDKITQGSIVVVGTNGKTTVTNMIADALEQAGHTVACNRTGANLAYGVATTLLQTKRPVEWGVFESDELWMARTLPQVQATYVILLNLFRDQLDRCGEIDRVQEAIAGSLEASPETVLVYNADDPLCATVASYVSNKKIAFGVGEDLHQEQNVVSDAQMCQLCSGMFTYAYRQYGQLGTYTCSHCGFTRPALDFAAKQVVFSNDISFCVEEAGAVCATLRGERAGAYMVYNVLAAWLAAHLAGVSNEVFQKAVDLFDPQNGRLQKLEIDGRGVLLNLAKNPTGFNQNMKLITQAEGKKVAAFFINDNEADGHDISWIWDCDFEELASQPDVIVYAGGIRKNDLQLRLKYAGINAQTVDSAHEVIDAVAPLGPEWQVYAIANYTSLPAVRQALMQRAASAGTKKEAAGAPFEQEQSKPEASSIYSKARVVVQQPNAVAQQSSVMVQQSSIMAQQPGVEALQQRPLRITHLYPDLLNLYGDGGNVRVLRKRCEWRGIPVEVEEVHYGQEVDLTQSDLVFLGGGPDREQRLASQGLFALKDALREYIEASKPLLAICGGYQILGKRWLLGEDEVEGLSILDMETLRAGAGFDRLIENIVLSSPLATAPVVGYENHAGRTYLGEALTPFGRVISRVGHGNNDDSGVDGVVYKHCIGTYLHGPLLGKNPEIADWLIAAALVCRGCPGSLVALDDAVERATNTYMAKRLGAS